MLDGRRKAIGNADDLPAERQALLKQRKATPLLLPPIKPRITSVRCADDFVIVLRSLPKTEAESITFQPLPLKTLAGELPGRNQEERTA